MQVRTETTYIVNLSHTDIWRDEQYPDVIHVLFLDERVNDPAGISPLHLLLSADPTSGARRM